MNLCSFCTKETRNPRFCSRKCSASFNNPLRKIRSNCLFCESIVNHRLGKYCSIKCQKSFEYEQMITNWKNGTECGWTGETKQIKNSIRRYLLEKHNNTCVKCGWNKLHPIDNKPLVEINHIDGDASNCEESNLEVICPNCHSMTVNFRARNKTSSRKRG